MEFVQTFGTPLLIPVILWYASRRSASVFAWATLSASAGLMPLALAIPTLTTFDAGPKLASGYHSWVFPAAAVVVSVVLWLWRSESHPGSGALLTCVPLSFAIHLCGLWSA